MKSLIFKRTMIAVLMVMLASVPALAFYPDNFVDIRTYHISHPGSEVMGTSGGYKIGLSGVTDNEASQIDYILLKGNKSQIKIPEPDRYIFLGNPSNDYTYWLGHNKWIDDTFLIEAIGAGPAVDYINNAGITIQPVPNLPKLNPVPIKQLLMTRNGMLRVLFTVPEDSRDTKIRIVVFEPDYSAFLTREELFPPYDKVVQHDIPDVYAGYPARIEYRAYGENMPMVRVITWFTLPDFVE